MLSDLMYNTASSEPFRTDFQIIPPIFNMMITCKIWGFHGGDYEEWCLLGCYAVWLL
jgi:hypothetical protein